jgi:hypothetical protein
MTDGKGLLAYLAGCIDCDGFITLTARRSSKRRKDGSLGPTHRYCIAIIGLGQITPLIPRLMQATFGGTVAEYDYPDRPRSRTSYGWQITNAQAAIAIRAMRPYLRLKTEQADLVLAFVERQGQFPRGKRLPEGETEQREAMSQRVVALNHGRRWNREFPNV